MRLCGGEHTRRGLVIIDPGAVNGGYTSPSDGAISGCALAFPYPYIYFDRIEVHEMQAVQYRVNQLFVSVDAGLRRKHSGL